jgi:hypothetical protein
LDLSLKERQTYLSLLRRWGSIPRRPPRNDIRDIDLLSIQSDCAQHAIKQLPRPSDKWASDSIFIASRRFPHEHDPRTWNTVRKYKLGCRPLQRAAVEIRQYGSQRFEIHRSLGKRVSGSLCGVDRIPPAKVLRSA